MHRELNATTIKSINLLIFLVVAFSFFFNKFIDFPIFLNRFIDFCFCQLSRSPDPGLYMNHILWSPNPGIVIGNSGLQMHRELNATTKNFSIHLLKTLVVAFSLFFNKFIETIVQ